MNLPSHAPELIKSYKEDPTNTKASSGLGSLYWQVVIKNISDIIHEEHDIGSFVRSEADFFDFGLLADFFTDVDKKRSEILDTESNYVHLEILRFSQWIGQTVAEILEGNKKKLIQQDIMAAKREIKKFSFEKTNAQETRKEVILNGLLGKSSSYTREMLIGQADKMSATDDLLLENARKKKEVTKGRFLSVEERREMVEREKQMQKDLRRNESLFSQIKDPDQRASLKEAENHIRTIFDSIADTESRLHNLEEKLQELETKSNSISAGEMESRLTISIEYIRDLTKLCAKRLRQESCPVLLPDSKHFTLKKLRACFNRILEFDPQVFHNERVSFLGKPKVLIMPGNGNAMYDWKNNMFIVPLCPPGGGFMGSIATAIIEYRFDVDEDKKLITSYWKLPECKNIKSNLQIKERLAKEYITWMTSEYKGYRVLKKESRYWFEHEVAPGKNDIYCPPQLQQFNLTTDEFSKRLKFYEEKVGNDYQKTPLDQLWHYSILLYQKGDYKKAYALTTAFVKRNSGFLFAVYNLAQLSMKLSRKQEAIAAFSAFAKKQPQSWWGSVARDHARRLQIG